MEATNLEDVALLDLLLCAKVFRQRAGRDGGPLQRQEVLPVQLHRLLRVALA